MRDSFRFLTREFWLADQAGRLRSSDNHRCYISSSILGFPATWKHSKVTNTATYHVRFGQTDDPSIDDQDRFPQTVRHPPRHNPRLSRDRSKS